MEITNIFLDNKWEEAKARPGNGTAESGLGSMALPTIQLSNCVNCILNFVFCISFHALYFLVDIDG